MNENISFIEKMSPVLYVLQKLTEVGKHQLSKILYFADREHLSKYGRTITGDSYFAFENGPVPSKIYDYLKVVCNDKIDSQLTVEEVQEVRKNIKRISHKDIAALMEPNMDFLSKSAVQSLDWAIHHCKNKSFKKLSDETHGLAWRKAYSNVYNKMNTLDIAKEVNANDKMLAYIQENE